MKHLVGYTILAALIFALGWSLSHERDDSRKLQHTKDSLTAVARQSRAEFSALMDSVSAHVHRDSLQNALNARRSAEAVRGQSQSAFVVETLLVAAQEPESCLVGLQRLRLAWGAHLAADTAVNQAHAVEVAGLAGQVAFFRDTALVEAGRVQGQTQAALRTAIARIHPTHHARYFALGVVAATIGILVVK